MIALIWHQNRIFWPFFRILWYKNDENPFIISWDIEKISISMLYSNAYKRSKVRGFFSQKFKNSTWSVIFSQLHASVCKNFNFHILEMHVLQKTYSSIKFSYNQFPNFQFKIIMINKTITYRARRQLEQNWSVSCLISSRN